MKLIFLDIDGVLNGHDYLPGATSNTIRRECVDQLSRILKATGAKVVLSSAWRYIVHAKAMSLSGFECLLRSHGTCGIVGKIIGVTAPDEHCPFCGYKHRRRRGNVEGYFNDQGRRVCVNCDRAGDRGDQIWAWLKQEVKVLTTDFRYVVIDDCDLGISKADHPFVQTNPARGLTGYTANKAIRILNGA